MLWFQPTPWGRWALALLIAAVALYVELRPDAIVEQPFATTDLVPGDVVDDMNSEKRAVPAGVLDGAAFGDVLSRPVRSGDPVLRSDVGLGIEVVPTGWWEVSVTLPQGADIGDQVRLVLLDTGREVGGVVAHPGSDDPFAAADGGVAIPPESSAEVALAAAEGRLAVLISTG